MVIRSQITRLDSQKWQREHRPDLVAVRMWVCLVCGQQENEFTDMFNHMKEHGYDISKLNSTNRRLYYPDRKTTK